MTIRLRVLFRHTFFQAIENIILLFFKL